MVKFNYNSKMMQIFARSRFFFPQTVKYLFCTQTTSLYSQLLAHYREYRPYKNIQIIHKITMERYRSNTAQAREQQIEIQKVIDAVSSQLHHVPHQDVNLLLQVLKERGAKYDADRPVFRGLNKLAKMVFGKHFRPHLLPMSLSYLKILKFPKTTISKLLNQFVNINSSLSPEEKPVSLNPLIKIVIISVQQPFITFPLVSKLMDIMLKQNATKLASLSSLLHLSRIMRDSFRKKIQYQTVKSSAKDILFNPYPHLQQEPVGSTQEQSSSAYEEDEEYRAGIKAKLEEMSTALMKKFSDSVDIAKLEQTIVDLIRQDLEPLTKEILIYACDIVALQPKVEEYLSEKMDRLSPVQFIYLVKRCKGVQTQLVDEYYSKLAQYMSAQEKAYLLLQAHRLFHRPITPQTILSIVQNLQYINYSSFIAVTKLTQTLLVEQKEKAKDIIEAVKAKMPKEG